MKNIPVVPVALLTYLLLASLSVAAQTIEVDASHPTNHFVPKETLGAGVDRIAAEAIDKDLLQPTLEKTLASGWQPVTYRQNTLSRHGTGIRKEPGAKPAAKDISPAPRIPRK
jgi:hypothetical protein